MIANMPLFSGINAASIIEFLPNIATRTFERGVQIVHHGARAGMLFLVIDGEVEIEQQRHRHRLGPGEAFGGVVGPQRDLSARTLTRVKVLQIDEHDLLHLSRDIPEFADRLAGLAPGKRRRQKAQETITRLMRTRTRIR
jgi:voltage-gated potassium channel